MHASNALKRRTVFQAAITAILTWIMVFGSLPLQAIADELLDDGQDVAIAATVEEDDPVVEAEGADEGDSPAVVDDSQDGAAVPADD